VKIRSVPEKWNGQIGVPRFVLAHRAVVRIGGLAFRCIAFEQA
jgi:hypothetical protein